MTTRIILASSSPYRRELMSRLNLVFEVISADIDESRRDSETPQAMVERLAVEKARAVAHDNNIDQGLIIGSDQTAELSGELLGKPRDHTHAVEQLQACSGHNVRLYTAVTVLNPQSGVIQHDVVPFEVEFRSLTLATIENYLKIEKPYNCCGSLKAEGVGIALLKRLSGNDPTAIIGLPLIRLTEMLANEGVQVV